ncbi:hypothetical protein FUAX_40530 (plasmid) [Fulvitalea axinellae]|uniref:DUF58 domain-containing protein n=1 Tax=Fulvitalea axinellae TaxID=1182444 RepID=A0AAU9DEI1_9BACT|nr:hypothetical protein FUAX_40530 [Fulvitalea axinellae]
MKKKKTQYPENVYTSLESLLSMEHLAMGFSFLAKKQKVKSILGGKHASKLRGRGMDYEESRNYVPGDDIRNIDWKVTARTQRTHTKVFSEEKEKPALIIVDQSQSMFFGSQFKTKATVAAEVAALAAFRVAREGDRVGGAVFSNDKMELLPPKRDRRNTLRFLEKIVSYNHQLDIEGDLTFEKQIHESIIRVNNLVTHDFLVIIISDFIHYSEEMIKTLRIMNRKNDVILARISDPMDCTLPSEEITLGEGSRQILAKGNNKSLREKFKTGYEKNLHAFEALMHQYRIPLIQLDTLGDVDKQLKEIIKMPK